KEAGRRGGRLGKSDARKPIALATSEMLILERTLRGCEPRVRLPVLLMAFAGMRRGEAYGLQRRDFDDAASTFSIHRIATHNEICAPKADSARVVPIPRWLSKEISAHLRASKVAALDGTDWLFTARNGGPIFNNIERTWTRVRNAFL